MALPTKIIKPYTGNGVPCLCAAGPKHPTKGFTLIHDHGEYRHLLPRFRHPYREHGLGSLEGRGNAVLRYNKQNNNKGARFQLIG